MPSALASKWGHILDDTEMTLMVEPYPGTQTIYEYINTCGDVEKTYPPNTTLIATVATDCAFLSALGDIKKFVVMENLGGISIGNAFTHIEDIVIKSTSENIVLWSSVGNLEIQEQKGGMI